MKLLWTFLKIVLVLALAVPVLIIALSTALGLLGALVGLAFLVLRIAVVGLVVWGAFSVLSWLMSWRSKPTPTQIREIAAPVDPYYEAAKPELDNELPNARG